MDQKNKSQYILKDWNNQTISDPNRIKLEISNWKICEKSLGTWQLKEYTSEYIHGSKRKSEVRKYIELTENENNTWNMWDVVK